MNTVTYPTGRTYNGPQVLVITIEQETLDEPWVGFRTIVATFTDASRRISGRVETIAFDQVGPEVLSKYDSGAYVELCYQEATHA